MGGPHHGYSHGAFKVLSDFSAVQVTDRRIEDSNRCGIHFEGTQQVAAFTFDEVALYGCGTAGI
jgi:hypothetical protein